MDGTDDVRAGGCMCGAVRYEVRGAPFWVGHCHCESCRKHTGAPLVTFVAFREEQVTFSKGARRIYESSPGVGRAFCGNCGTPLTWEGQGRQEGLGMIYEFHISTLDAPDEVRPENHVFYPERISWFDVADHLPRHRGMYYKTGVEQYGPTADGLPG